MMDGSKRKYIDSKELGRWLVVGSSCRFYLGLVVIVWLSDL